MRFRKTILNNMDEPEVLTQTDANLFAAVDLGSNSFHMIIARLDEGELKVIDRLREHVKLAGGFDENGNLTDAARDRAIDCLSRFGERLKNIPIGQVRAVGTNALRTARNSRDLLKKVRAALGHPIEVISGHEEARVLYLGVARSLAGDAGRRLVVDIGGGSTECIIGEDTTPQITGSLYMGCVGYSLRFFGDGKLTREAFKEASLAARVELEPIVRRFRSMGWEHTVGSSGTIKSIDAILRENGWGDGGITLNGIRQLRKAMIAQKSIGKLNIVGLSSERAAVLSGGLAILDGVFKSLNIESMTASQGALREGLLYELVGSIRSEDTRDQTVRALMQRFGVDTEQADRVEATALRALDQVAGGWDLLGKNYRQSLIWAAHLHEIGLAVSYSGYHRHGGYLLANSDLSGFSRDQQIFLADLVRSQRRALDSDVIEELESVAGTAATRVVLLLRLAVTLNRARDPNGPPDSELVGDERGYELNFPGEFLDEHPLTKADLTQEQTYLQNAGYKIKLS